MKNIQSDALFTQLEDGHSDKEAYFECYCKNQLMLFETQSKRLKTTSKAFWKQQRNRTYLQHMGLQWLQQPKEL
jgi:hypothetical protein